MRVRVLVVEGKLDLNGVMTINGLVEILFISMWWTEFDRR